MNYDDALIFILTSIPFLVFVKMLMNYFERKSKRSIKADPCSTNNHAFEDIYDSVTEAIKPEVIAEYKPGLDCYRSAEMSELNGGTETYVHSICLKCGKVVKRDQEVSD